MSFPAISWTVGGLPFNVEDGWTATAIAQGGFDRFQGVITEAAWRKYEGYATQGSVVKGWINGAEPLWEGRLATIPDFSEGKATIAAMGYYVKAIKKVDRLFIQSRDMDIWQPLDGEPFLDGSGNPAYAHYRKITVNVGNRIRWMIPDNDAIAINAGAGAGFYAEGANLRRVVFTMYYDAADETADFDIETFRVVNGPTGAATSDNTRATNNANNGGTFDVTLGASGDQVNILLTAAAAHTAGSTRKYVVSRIRVNSDIELTDTFHAWEVADYIGTQLSYDTTGIVTSTFNVLPFDQEGDWASMLDYVAELEDHVWGVYDDAGSGPRLIYDDWGTKTWQCYLSHGAAESLAPLEVFNRVRVFYESPTGVRRSVAADASP